MPGLFGFLGFSKEREAAFAEDFSAIWPGSSFRSRERQRVGAHAHGDGRALHELASGSILLIDGDGSLYADRRIERACREANGIAVAGDSVLTAAGACGSGNFAFVEPDGTVTLKCASAGAYPLFYTEDGEHFAFSSLLKPLSGLLHAAADAHAVLHYLRSATVLGTASLFRGIRRLLPGQTLVRSANGTVRVCESTDSWVRVPEVSAQIGIEALWESLTAATRRISDAGNWAVMMSGGWDSRTLLAAAGNANAPGLAYSHGDPASRELQLAGRLAALASIPSEHHALHSGILDPSLLSIGFARTESLSFPHWLWAGQYLARAGYGCVTAGILGEVLGGHYGPAMLGSNGRRLLSLASQLAGIPSLRKGASRLSALDTLQFRDPIPIPWYVSADFAAGLGNAQHAFNDSIAENIARHRRRGVTDEDALVEAHITEHRGAMYIAAQLRSSRSFTDVSVPFGDPVCFVLASQLPLHSRVHNKANRRLLMRHAPHLATLPMAATLVPASLPIVVQEISRGLRKAKERLPIGIRANRPRLGWVDFEFLRSGEALHRITQSLAQPIWNTRALSAAVTRLQSGDPTVNAHSLFDQLMKVATIDCMLSRAEPAFS